MDSTPPKCEDLYLPRAITHSCTSNNAWFRSHFYFAWAHFTIQSYSRTTESEDQCLFIVVETVLGHPGMQYYMMSQTHSQLLQGPAKRVEVDWNGFRYAKAISAMHSTPYCI